MWSSAKRLVAPLSNLSTIVPTTYCIQNHEHAYWWPKWRSNAPFLWILLERYLLLNGRQDARLSTRRIANEANYLLTI